MFHVPVTAGLILFSVVVVVDVGAYSANEIMKGDTTTLYTPNIYAYEYFGLELLERDFIVFRVRACSDIHVALMQLRGDTSFNLTEVVIGGWSNTRSVYRNGVLEDQRHYLDVETPDIAHCTEMRTFWISWGMNRLRTGRGPNPGEQTFMELDRTNNFAHHIRFAGFSTGFGVTGVWEVEENQGYYLVVRTPDDNRYEYVWKTAQYKDNHFIFFVLGCSDIHVNLSPQMGAVYYEAVIGGWNNTKSIIRVSNVHMQENNEVGLVSCTEWRPFWISWSDATIRVGKGRQLYKNTFLEWNDQNFAGVNHLSFRSGFGHAALWAFNDDLENNFLYVTQPDQMTNSPNYNLFLSAVDKEHFILELQACKDVWVELTPFPGDSESSEQIYIGVDNNTKSGVRNGFSPNPIIEVQTAGVLSCVTPQIIWISWYGNQRQVGHGPLVGYFAFLTWTSAGQVTSVGMANAFQSGAYYLMRKNAGDSLITLTPSLYYYQSMWMTVRQDVMVTFRVRACKDVSIHMSSIIGVKDRDTYEVFLGACYMSMIRDMASGDTPMVEVSTPDILHCYHFRSFWISWLNGFVKVGTGSLYDKGVFLQLPNSKPHPINAISISTYDAVGVWELEADTGDELLLQTPNTEQEGETNMKWLHLHSWVYWFHFRVQGNGARLILAPKYRDSANAYHVHIGSESNTQYSICKGADILVTYTQPGILHNNEFTEFWLSWKDGRIQLGPSKYRTNLPLIEWLDPSPMTVTAVAFHGASGSFADWRVSSRIASELSVWTERYQSYEMWLSIRHRASMVFALQSCGHAEVLISAAWLMWFETDSVYTVVLQDPQGMTSIWQGNRNKKLVEKNTPDLLSCYEERQFWLSWYNGHIALGKGRVRGTSTVVSFQDLNPSPMYALSLSSFQTAGSWRIPLNSEEFIEIPPPEATSQSLSGGEIAGIVIGTIVMVALFVVMVVLIVVGPDKVRAKLDEIRRKGDSSTSTASAGGSSSSSPTVSVSTAGFDNPLSMTEFSEIKME